MRDKDHVELTSRNYRPLSEYETQLVSELLTPEFPGRDEIVIQVQNALVSEADDDGCIEFKVNGGIHAAEVKSRVPTEGEYDDLDGIRVHILLHVVAGTIRELEFYKDDNSRIMKSARPGELKVFAPWGRET